MDQKTSLFHSLALSLCWLRTLLVVGLRIGVPRRRPCLWWTLLRKRRSARCGRKSHLGRWHVRPRRRGQPPSLPRSVHVVEGALCGGVGELQSAEGALNRAGGGIVLTKGHSAEDRESQGRRGEASEQILQQILVGVWWPAPGGWPPCSGGAQRAHKSFFITWMSPVENLENVSAGAAFRVMCACVPSKFGLPRAPAPCATLLIVQLISVSQQPNLAHLLQLLKLASSPFTQFLPSPNHLRTSPPML